MRLTSREQEIAEIIRKDPLISQDELALRLKISRSSVGVHISNLMKKGVIIGKGYVFNNKVSMVVVGEVFLEINAKEYDNKTQIDFKCGGFGIEVSKILASYGINVKVVTIVGNDDLGTSILGDLKRMDVDVANIFRHPEKRTCRKILTNESAIHIEGYSWQEYEQVMENREWVLFNCDWLVVESPFQEYICQRTAGKEDNLPYFCGCRYIDQDIPDYMDKFSLVVLGVPGLQDYNRFLDQGMELIKRGTQNCVITDGRNSIYCLNAEGVRDFALLPNQSFNSQTQINLFLAGLVHGLSSGYPMRQAIRIAVGTASAKDH
jgi:sugar/nucleoside kinase (ribokinase family)/DNA-binding CsgD family transcriptional regulator